MSYSIEISHLTATSCLVYIDDDGAAGNPQNLTFYESDGTTAVKSISASDPGWDMSLITVNGLTPNTTYIAKLDDDPTVTATFTTLTDDPKVATESMWADLAARVKAKADASSIPTVNNSTITVTNNGLDKGTFTTNQATAGTVALDYPTITMTTTDPGEGSALAENNYVAVYGADPIILDYSTTEINTGAKWIDGSAIYKKTINFGALPSSGNKSVAHNIASFGTLVDIKAMLYDTGTSRYKPLNLPQGNNTDWIVLEVNSTNVFAYVGSDFSNSTAYVTLYYTKSS